MFEDLIPELQEPATAIVAAAGRAGLQPRITSTRRSAAQQARLYRKWQAGASPYPVAPPGLSSHEYGFAFDMVVSPMESLEDVGYTWQSWGGVWGAQRDPVHFEYPGFVAPAATAGPETVSLWDYAMTALSFTSLVSLLLELGYVVSSRAEAEKIARILHIDPSGTIF